MSVITIEYAIRLTMEGDKSIPPVRDITVTEEQQMEIVTSASCVKESSDDDDDLNQHKSDVIDDQRNGSEEAVED